MSTEGSTVDRTQRAKNGKAGVNNIFFSHNSCKNKARFAVEACMTANYSNPQARDGMGFRRGFSDIGATELPSIVDGSKRWVYCDKHAEDGIVDV